MSPRGGKRPGAGRIQQEPTTVIRVPSSKLNDIKSLLNNVSYLLPVYSSKVQAGFPSPADDYLEGHLDLNTQYIRNPAATFVVKATGDSMLDAGIFPNDLLLVDRSITPKDGQIVIAALNGELTVKRLSSKNDKIQLMPANPKYKPIEVKEGLELIIWGVVTLVLHEPDY